MLKPVEFNDFFIFSINSHGITFILAPGRGPGARLERNGRALGARRGRSGRELGACHARQRRCFPFKCNRTNTLTSGPPGHLCWLARSKVRPWPLDAPQSNYPGDCSKAGGNLPHPPAPLPALRVLAPFFSGGQFRHLGMFFLPPFGSVSPSPGALNSSASPRLLPLDPPRRPHRELNPRAPAREATSDTTRPRDLGQ